MIGFSYESAWQRAHETEEEREERLEEEEHVSWAQAQADAAGVPLYGPL